MEKTVWVTIQKEYGGGGGGRRGIARYVTTEEADWEDLHCFQVAGRGKRRGNYVPEVSVPVQLPEVDLDAVEEMLRPLD